MKIIQITARGGGSNIGQVQLSVPGVGFCIQPGVGHMGQLFDGANMNWGQRPVSLGVPGEYPFEASTFEAPEAWFPVFGPEVFWMQPFKGLNLRGLAYYGEADQNFRAIILENPTEAFERAATPRRIQQTVVGGLAILNAGGTPPVSYVFNDADIQGSSIQVMQSYRGINLQFDKLGGSWGNVYLYTRGLGLTRPWVLSEMIAPGASAANFYRDVLAPGFLGLVSDVDLTVTVDAVVELG